MNSGQQELKKTFVHDMANDKTTNDMHVNYEKLSKLLDAENGYNLQKYVTEDW